ncbi:MAG: exodeoxyribonuclease VII large subunit [Desulfohalobiaceae bacterium]|nr:exodeoxyribonuclease VII large subunit [Desulfohalobiaceae bacterium]
MAGIYSVSQITRAIKEDLETRYPFLWVQGQIGTLSRPGSGHIYFTLKDSEASLNVAWFRSSQTRSGIAPQSLESGAEVVCAGRMAVYPPRGVYQLIADLVEDRGVGSLQLQFEALKRKLAGQGYFAPENKQPLPSHAARVAVVTAADSAALHDFLRLSRRRGWPGEIRIHPTPVQGDAAPDSVARAVDEVNSLGWAQILVLIRGGGSLEDLWTFNTETVAHALYRCGIPVLTGIGHEVDLTIADMVADTRASTPSHAAQLLWPERTEMMQQVDEAEAALYQAWKNRYTRLRDELEELSRALSWLSPVRRLQQLRQTLELQEAGLRRSASFLLQTKQGRLQQLVDRLQRTFGPDGWRVREQAVRSLEERLEAAAKAHLQNRKNELNRTADRLEALDPHLPLKRGYSLVTVDRSGEFLRNAEQVDSGEEVSILTERDRIGARIK